MSRKLRDGGWIPADQETSVEVSGDAPRSTVWSEAEIRFGWMLGRTGTEKVEAVRAEDAFEVFSNMNYQQKEAVAQR